MFVMFMVEVVEMALTSRLLMINKALAMNVNDEGCGCGIHIHTVFIGFHHRSTLVYDGACANAFLLMMMLI